MKNILQVNNLYCEPYKAWLWAIDLIEGHVGGASYLTSGEKKLVSDEVLPLLYEKLKESKEAK